MRPVLSLPQAYVTECRLDSGTQVSMLTLFKYSRFNN